MPAPLPMLRDGITALTPREKGFVATGGAATLLFVAHMVVPEREELAVKLSASPPARATSVPPTSIPVPPPAPLPFAAPAPELGGIVLRGVIGGGPAGGAAIVDLGSGGQRVVRIGREITAGLVLREVGLAHAVARGSAGDVRLELGKPGGIAIPSASSQPAPVEARTAAGQLTEQQETMQYRLGLQPVKSGAGRAGYAIKPGARLPHLQAAGLQAGDLILSVNGSQLDEERLMELSWQIANSGSTEVEYIRAGERRKARIRAQPEQ